MIWLEDNKDLDGGPTIHSLHIMSQALKICHKMFHKVPMAKYFMQRASKFFPSPSLK